MPRIPRSARLRAPKVLNRSLYSLLLARIGPVAIGQEGEDAVLGTPTRGHRNASLVTSGEYYKVSCPYCGDTRQRLYVNHRWCVPDPVTDKPSRWLAICYNENCLENSGHYRDFEERVFGWENASARRARMQQMKIAPGKVVELGPVEPPGPIISIDQLDDDHPAVTHLADRGFGIHELAERWHVGYCPEAYGIYHYVGGRIYIPVESDGELVGWQCRYVGDVDWKATKTRKYLNCRFSKASRLYNLDRAAKLSPLVVCEGVTDVWAVGDNGVALLGKNASAQQIELMARTTRRGGVVALLLDRQARLEDPEKYAIKLAHLTEQLSGAVVDVELPDDRDPGDYHRDALWRIIRSECRRRGFACPRSPR